MDADQTNNPLDMYQLPQDGPYVLPETFCSERRQEFIGRCNAILGFYTVTTIVSKEGSEAFFRSATELKFKDETILRLKLNPGEAVVQLNYGLFKKTFSRAGSHLTNQIFLMLYGNFEAYIADLVQDGLTQQGIEDPQQETLNLMVMSKWRGKIDRIGEKLGFKIGKRKFVAKFKNIELEFLGDLCSHPLEFLEKASDLRNRLVHSSGRADHELVRRYPNSNMKIGDTISLPYDLPFQLNLFFIHLSDLFDEIFTAKFGWKRTLIAPERILSD